MMRVGPCGFTLIEMLVVMALVTLLLSIALPRYFGSVDKSKDIALQEDLHILRSNLDKYYSDKGRYPDSLEELVVNKYLRAVPIDPITESSDTWILVAPEGDDMGGIADVKSGAPGMATDGRSYDSL